MPETKVVKYVASDEAVKPKDKIIKGVSTSPTHLSPNSNFTGADGNSYTVHLNSATVTAFTY